MNGGFATVSLRAYGLYAPDGLECSAGGHHNVPENGLRVIATSSGQGVLQCLKCGGDVRLATLPDR